jgi:hypothetical protein
MVGKPSNAYERSMVGEVAGFSTFKLDSGKRIAAAGGGSGITMDTRATALNYYVPVSTRIAATGEKSNVDNRYQTITVSSTDQRCCGRLLHHRGRQCGASHQQGRHRPAQDVPRHLGAEFDHSGHLAADHLQPGRFGR